MQEGDEEGTGIKQGVAGWLAGSLHTTLYYEAGGGEKSYSGRRYSYAREEEAWSVSITLRAFLSSLSAFTPTLITERGLMVC